MADNTFKKGPQSRLAVRDDAIHLDLRGEPKTEPIVVPQRASDTTISANANIKRPA